MATDAVGFPQMSNHTLMTQPAPKSEASVLFCRLKHSVADRGGGGDNTKIAKRTQIDFSQIALVQIYIQNPGEKQAGNKRVFRE